MSCQRHLSHSHNGRLSWASLRAGLKEHGACSGAVLPFISGEREVFREPPGACICRLWKRPPRRLLYLPAQDKLRDVRWTFQRLIEQGIMLELQDQARELLSPGGTSALPVVPASPGSVCSLNCAS